MALRYEVVTSARSGQERVHAYASEEAIRPRDVLRLQGRDWLVVSVEDGEPARAIAKAGTPPLAPPPSGRKR